MVEKMNKTSFVLVAVLAAMLPYSHAVAQEPTPAQRAQIEQIAAGIAKKHNEARLTDDITISSIATSDGSNVRFTNVLRIRADAPASKLRQFKDMNMRETTQKACAANKTNPVFARGLTYTFSYLDQRGKPIQEFTVSKEICASVGRN